jgi:hypothetical protein
MTIPNDEETAQLEEYLKNFHPRAAKALDIRPQRKKLGFALTLGVAAVLAIAFFVISVHRSQSPVTVNVHTNPAITVMQLNAAIRRGESLDAVLDESGKQTLPPTTTPHTALNALSKE